MSTTYSTTHILKPSWSRLLHRMHTIGYTKQHYQNSLATITSEGNYPVLLPSFLEDKSYTLEGDQEWKLDQWQQGLVKVNPDFQQAEFQFISESGETFHKVKLTPKSQWECFECVLKLFESARIDHFTEMKDHISPVKQVNKNIAHVAKALNREIIRGKRIICSLPLSGGSKLRGLEVKTLMTQFGRVALKHNQGHLQLNSSSVNHIKIVQKANNFVTTLFNAKGELQLRLQAV